MMLHPLIFDLDAFELSGTYKILEVVDRTGFQFELWDRTKGENGGVMKWVFSPNLFVDSSGKMDPAPTHIW